MAITPSSTLMTDRNFDTNEVFRNLIESTEDRNQMVRKLNESKRYCRLDHNYLEVISDDEVEVDQPNINLFMNVDSNLLDDTPADSVHGLENQSISATSANRDIPVGTPVASIQDTMGLISQRNVLGNTEPGSITGKLPLKLSTINYHSLGPIYCIDKVSKNKHLLDMTKIPNAILQMAYLKLYIPLSLLMTSALSKICSNNGLKYHKIPFGNGAGWQSLDESLFPAENMLSESLFLQVYHNWLTIIDIIASPEVAIRWYEHHSKMLQDQKFLASFEAWRDMDRQLHTQFIDNPFILDPTCSTYIQLFERAWYHASI